MKKTILSITILLSSSSLYADWTDKIKDMLSSSLRIELLQSSILNIQKQMLNAEQEMLSTQKDIEGLMKDVNHDLTGHSGWGTFQFHDYQSYGEELGQTINSIDKQFPTDPNVFKQGISDKQIQNYYALKSQTVLATRAASQLDYNKIQDQIQYQQMLQQQIEKVNDVKAAIDLNNRLQIEANLIQLQMLRQMALTSQQQAVTEQASLNAALSNAKFLTPPKQEK